MTRSTLSRSRLLPAAILGAALVAMPAHAARHGLGDATRGRLLYENHCTACHTSQAHVRENRKAETLPQVRGWVARWQSTQSLGWTADDISDVATWLYLRFYDPDRPRAP